MGNLAQTPDLTQYAREPVRTPGSIQPHGVLFVLQEPQLTVLQVSHNTFEFIGRHPHELLNQPLATVLDSQHLDMLQNCLLKDFESINPLKISITNEEELLSFDGIIHRHDGVLLLELEPNPVRQNSNFFSFYHQTKSSIDQIQKASTLQQMSQIVVEEIRKVTGFDRVMIYRFDPQGAGVVTAEDKADRLNTWLGLHYPAFDIPLEARELFILNALRFIPDVEQLPTPIVPIANPMTQRSLDLGKAILRSASSCHLEYLHNMGVKASMTISLIRDRQLWGLIACHHYSSSKHLTYEVRTICEFLGQIMSLELGTKADHEDREYRIKLQSLQPEFVQCLTQADNLLAGLVQSSSNLLQLVSASGVAICWDDEITLVGQTPQLESVQALLTWLTPQISNNIFHTHELPKLYPAAASFQASASGVLALAISQTRKSYILWFRPEVTQTVSWSGDPQQNFTQEAGEARLSPRRSFELWQEIVRSTALPWKPCELEAVADLRGVIVGVVLRQADELARINVELERTNDELDAFAYIASHDLKEPLRGIHNYSSFLIEDYADILNEEGVAKLQTLMRLTQRMEDLINSLLHFSRLGRIELLLKDTDLNQIISQVESVVKISQPDTPIAIHIPRSLPAIYCDPVQINELFTNLISNAIKYNDQPEKQVEIGYLTMAELPEQNPVSKISSSVLVLYVKDNGIGIREKYLDSIFRIFKRLHGQAHYGGGTGVGLTISKKIVERHGGKIWVESTYGLGSTFYFTLAG
jgi:light-regulated signal transduction histidine kinase (bacteriophytochrome)